jgi:hypothetical protein
MQRKNNVWLILGAVFMLLGIKNTNNVYLSAGTAFLVLALISYFRNKKNK